MTAYVLAPIVGDGSEGTPFSVDGARAIIDLRADPTVAGGWAIALLRDDADMPADAVELIDSRLPDAATERIPKQARDKVMDRLGLNLGSEQLGATTAEILLSGKEDGSRWLPLRRQADGWWRVFCGGLLWEQASIDGGAVVYDSFDRADSTSLGTADTGQTWQDPSDTWGISSNRAEKTSSNSRPAFVESGLADTVVSCDIEHGSNENNGVSFRLQDVDNIMMARLGADVVQLYKRVQSDDPEWTLIVEEPMDLVIGQVYAFRVEFSGSSIEVLVDGVSKITATESYLSSETHHGLYGLPDALWDDFRIDSVRAAIAHGLTLSHDATGRAVLRANAAHGLTLAHAADARATVEAALAHGLTLSHAVKGGVVPVPALVAPELAAPVIAVRVDSALRLGAEVVDAADVSSEIEEAV